MVWGLSCGVSWCVISMGCHGLSWVVLNSWVCANDMGVIVVLQSWCVVKIMV